MRLRSVLVRAVAYQRRAAWMSLATLSAAVLLVGCGASTTTTTTVITATAASPSAASATTSPSVTSPTTSIKPSDHPPGQGTGVALTARRAAEGFVVAWV